MTDGIAPHDPSYCTNDRIPVHQRPPDPTSPAKHGNLLDVPTITIMMTVTTESHGDIQVALAIGEQQSSDSSKDIALHSFIMSLFCVASLPSSRWMIPLCCSNGTVGRFMLRTVDKSPRSTSHDAGSPHVHQASGHSYGVRHVLLPTQERQKQTTGSLRAMSLRAMRSLKMSTA
jgi:hypothetical protein